MPSQLFDVYNMLNGPSFDFFLKETSKIYPISHALWRVWEYFEILDQQLKYPLLDLGCGDGRFLSIILNSPSRKGEAGEIYGIDPNYVDCKFARKSNLYKDVLCSSSHKMPFEPEKFRMVFSNCVLEHIPELEETFLEVNRVLKPGGIFFFTALSDFYPENLFYVYLFRKLKLNFLSDLYVKFVENVLKHYNCLSGERWTELLNNSGFNVKSIKYTHSSKYLKIFDVLMALSSFQYVMAKAFCKVPFPSLNRLMISSIVKNTIKDEYRLVEGANVNIVAEKVK